jgi:hypothetical protein
MLLIKKNVGIAVFQETQAKVPLFFSKRTVTHLTKPKYWTNSELCIPNHTNLSRNLSNNYNRIVFRLILGVD